MSRRSALLELAVLGLLHDSPMHGYELRKRLNAVLGAFRALSFGTLYPCLRDLVARGWIAEDAATDGQPGAATGSVGSSRRARIVYKLTAEGKDHLHRLLSQSGPSAWEDDTFNVHFAFFARTEADVRLRRPSRMRSRTSASVRAKKAKCTLKVSSSQADGPDWDSSRWRWSLPSAVSL